MKKMVFTAADSYSPTILRTLLGIVIFAHGAQKLLGWFGGYGFKGTMDFFTQSAGLSWITGFFVIIIEFFGAIVLLVGFAVRIWSLAIVLLMAGIVQTTHLQNGFFMNWFGNQQGEGYEYFILVIAIALSLLVTGAGNTSIDKLIAKKQQQ